MLSCNNDDKEKIITNPSEGISKVELYKRPGLRPETTLTVPHFQIGVNPVPEVNEELYRRVYSIPGIEQKPSAASNWDGLYLTEDVSMAKPEATIEDREFGHIHTDGSLHIFLDPSRSQEAVDSCWAVFHPWALQETETGEQTEPGEEQKSWKGFVMLYTPLSIEELNVTFQLIVDGYNNVTGQNIIATDFY